MDKEKEQAKANTNTGILHSVQDDDAFLTLQHLRGLPGMEGCFQAKDAR